jgi:hypothetical protein
MSCSCHISPPCNYCMEKYECCRCGEFKHPSDSSPYQAGTDERLLCTECFEGGTDEPDVG